MKTLSLALLLLILSFYMSFGQSQQTEIKHKHSIGASLFMLYNFSSDSPDYYLFTYGYQLTPKDRIFVEFNTWRYNEPLGTYDNSKEFYPGDVREFGVGFGYQRFLWKGLFSTVQATPFLKNYTNENQEKIQNGFKIYLQFALGYRIEFFKNRVYLEPAVAFKYWPVDTNFPSSFAEIEKGSPNNIFEPSLNCGFKF